MKKLFFSLLFLFITLPVFGQSNGQLAQARIKYVTSLPATCRPNQGLVYAVIGSLPLHYHICTNTNTFYDITSGTATLTSGRVGFGVASVLGSSADFLFNDTTKNLTVNNGSGGAFLNLTGTSDTSAVKFGTGAHPGNGGGIIFPFVGGGMSTGPGTWWCANDYTQCSGIWISNGLNYQGASGTHSPVKIRKSTGTSADGGIVFTFTPDSGLFTHTKDSVGVTSADGYVLQNTTVAAAGAQQFSPRFRLTGQGWKTNATAASQTVDWIMENQPVQGAANPSTDLVFSNQINAAGYNSYFKIKQGRFDFGGSVAGDTTVTSGNVMSWSATGSGTATLISPSGSVNFQVGGGSVLNVITGGLMSVAASSGFRVDTTSGFSTAITIRPLGVAGSFAWGAADAASPVAQTHSVQGVVAGTSNTAGVDWKRRASVGTGTGVGGSHIWEVAPAGTSGTTQNAQVEAMRIAGSGVIQFPTTITAGGTTGNQTIDKVSGTVNIAAAGTTVTVTNNKVSANSICFAVVRTNDTTALIKNVVPGAGSFVINMNAAVTAETSIGFWCINP